jgi:hypothetical protein
LGCVRLHDFMKLRPLFISQWRYKFCGGLHTRLFYRKIYAGVLIWSGIGAITPPA